MGINLHFTIDKQKLSVVQDFVVADSIGYLYADFVFSDDWTNPVKTAQFTKNGITYDVVINNNQCLIPWEVLVYGGFVYVNIFSGNLITANPVSFAVAASGLRKGQLPTEPTPGYFSQLIDAIVNNHDEILAILDEQYTASEASRNSSFATSESNRSTTFVASEAARQEASDGMTASVNGALGGMQSAFGGLMSSMGQGESDRIAAETLRNDAETIRISSEESRDIAESARTNSESDRNNFYNESQGSENSRVTAENARQSEESNRVNAETDRQSYVNSVQQNESERIASETVRLDGEASRVTQENLRVIAESARESSESSRALAESARVIANVSASSAENSRAVAESARVSAEENRENTTSAALASLILEDERINNEAARVVAENARVTAESLRVSETSSALESLTGESVRVTQEATRQSNEATRIINENARIARGETGTIIRNGNGAPPNALGANGDYYLDASTSDLYFKQYDYYLLLVNLKGAPGVGGGSSSIENWNDFTLENGFSVSAGRTPRYRKNNDGLMTVEGDIDVTASTSYASPFTFPPGYYKSGYYTNAISCGTDNPNANATLIINNGGGGQCMLMFPSGTSYVHLNFSMYVN